MQTCSCTVCQAYRPSGCGQEAFALPGYAATCCGWCYVTHSQALRPEPKAPARDRGMTYEESMVDAGRGHLLG